MDKYQKRSSQGQHRRTSFEYRLSTCFVNVHFSVTFVTMLLTKQNIRLFVISGIIILLLPLLIAFIEVSISDKNAVVFFEGYPTVVSITLLSAYIVLFVVLVSFGIYKLVQLIQTTLVLRTEQQKMELQHLQSQVNPHFFFNMLNNLYGLVAKDTEKAQALILKLSDMMRYSIYDGQQTRVNILQEIAYLQNYIELHTMRYHKKIDIQFHTDIQDENATIVPLLCIILLENAFKHGVENKPEGAFVHIHLAVTTNEIYFAVTNNFDAAALSTEKGIGLQNLKRRLELIYPKKHLLSFDKHTDVYKAQLRIQRTNERN